MNELETVESVLKGRIDSLNILMEKYKDDEKTWIFYSGMRAGYESTLTYISVLKRIKQ